MFNSTKAKKDFDDFLFSMDDQLEAIDAEANKLHIPLDQTMDNLENLETLFFKMSENSGDEEIESLVVSFARYVGEIVRISYGGKWHLPLDDSKNIYFNTPVIVGHTSIPDLLFSPIDAMRALAIRKKSGLLRQIIMADIQPQDLDLDHLEEH